MDNFTYSVWSVNSKGISKWIIYIKGVIGGHFDFASLFLPQVAYHQILSITCFHSLFFNSLSELSFLTQETALKMSCFACLMSSFIYSISFTRSQFFVEGKPLMKDACSFWQPKNNLFLRFFAFAMIPKTSESMMQHEYCYIYYDTHLVISLNNKQGKKRI